MQADVAPHGRIGGGKAGEITKTRGGIFDDLGLRHRLQIVGFLRFSRFWGRVPYMEMIRVLPGHRRSGVGTALFLAWEEAMRGERARLLMTSSECDESRPQDWHRRNGFTETGAIELPGLQSVPEVFFIKPIA